MPVLNRAEPVSAVFEVAFLLLGPSEVLDQLETPAGQIRTELRRLETREEGLAQPLYGFEGPAPVRRLVLRYKERCREIVKHDLAAACGKLPQGRQRFVDRALCKVVSHP